MDCIDNLKLESKIIETNDEDTNNNDANEKLFFTNINIAIAVNSKNNETKEIKQYKDKSTDGNSN